MTLTANFLGLVGSDPHRGRGSLSSQLSRHQVDDQRQSGGETQQGRGRPIPIRPHSQAGQGKKLSKDEADQCPQDLIPKLVKIRN